jgi:hypothetical protein
MACIHDQGTIKLARSHPTQHCCVIDDEVCCEYWFGIPQKECIYFIEGDYSEKKSKITLLEHQKARLIVRLIDVNGQLGELNV